MTLLAAVCEPVPATAAVFGPVIALELAPVAVSEPALAAVVGNVLVHVFESAPAPADMLGLLGAAVSGLVLAVVLAA